VAGEAGGAVVAALFFCSLLYTFPYCVATFPELQQM
jgi:hypothetical protein